MPRRCSVRGAGSGIVRLVQPVRVVSRLRVRCARSRVAGCVRGALGVWGLVPRGGRAVRAAVSRLRVRALFAGCERAARAIAVRAGFGERLRRVRLSGPLKGLRRGRVAAVPGRPERVPCGEPESLSRFMDYGPDWPPVPKRRRIRHPLVRRCLAVIMLYAVIWALGSILLEFRLYQLRDAGGASPKTYPTGSPHP